MMGLVGCSDDASGDDGGEAGSGGTSTGGTSGSSTGGATSGTGGSGATPSGGTAGAAGTTSGGTAGAGATHWGCMTIGASQCGCALTENPPPDPACPTNFSCCATYQNVEQGWLQCSCLYLDETECPAFAASLNGQVQTSCPPP
jgi:hypothetical protein